MFNFIEDYLKQENIKLPQSMQFEQIKNYKMWIKQANRKNKDVALKPPLPSEIQSPKQQHHMKERNSHTSLGSQSQFKELPIKKVDFNEVYSERKIQTTEIQNNNSTLDMTILPSFPNKKIDDSFYDTDNLEISRINEKLTQLYQNLNQELKQNQLPYTQMILGQMIQDLNQILDTKNSQLVKTIIYRIEQGIEKLKNQKEGSITLFNYLNKAIKHGQKKMNTLIVNNQLELSNSQTQTRFSEQLDSSQESYSKYQQRFTLDLDIRPSQIEFLSLKRRFYDLALKKKSKSERLKNILVSDLYDEFLKLKIDEQEMENFIDQKLQLK